jgi:hypothetical protein
MIIQFFKKMFSREGDPVYHCDVYKDKANGSCAHVDGMLCDFPDCSILKEYKEKKQCDPL